MKNYRFIKAKKIAAITLLISFFSVMAILFTNATTAEVCDFSITGTGIKTTSENIRIASIRASNDTITIYSYNKLEWSPGKPNPTYTINTIKLGNGTVTGGWGEANFNPGYITHIQANRAENAITFEGQKYNNSGNLVKTLGKIIFAGRGLVVDGGALAENVNNLFPSPVDVINFHDATKRNFGAISFKCDPQFIVQPPPPPPPPPTKEQVQATISIILTTLE